ncbi:hypothetical protein R5R35_003958 [Gryllus longicercus]|uniref:PDZ domain-containing protein n=1 Tax=Gryllus longicercus TaxID=2509291 RepID=A0AAN9VCX9_9ORTH
MPWDCFACLKPESTDIKQLNYEHCTLNDVPAEVFAFERTLEELHLDSNRIRDLPRPLFHCHGLKVLSLSDNEVHSLPPAIASLINLHHLDVSRNALNSIPDNLKGCKHLTYVDVSVNPLEKLPEGFTQLISLEELYLNDTYLDFLPANFGRLMRLRILELRENNLNTLPKSIARLAHLQRLDIGQNDFSDVPEVIGNLPNLTELWVDSNRIRSIPPLIGNLKKLVHLEASNNNIRSVASEIEHCAKLLDLSLTCNELTSLPNTLGNLRELVTLKVDDNQLSMLPNTIGKLSNLEELILSQNDLESLPACIGLLRKLHVLNVDDNMLEELPPEIGSCTSLTILSAHSNKLQHVPAELGHLSNLRVINLSENQLQNLPVSILNLVHLTALWLSNNQSTPLTTLQQEIDKHTGQMVCTNFMLPQSTQECNPIEGHWVRQEVCANAPTKVKQHISFATDTDAEAPSRLMRAPTPYPKELRAMAKHARAMHHLKRSPKENEDDLPVVEEMVSQEPKDVLIKEAKVKKPSIDPVIMQSVVQHVDKNLDILGKQIDCKGYVETNTILQEYDDMTYGNSLGEMPSVIALDTGPVVREAKCVRKINTPITNSSALTESRQRESVVSNSEQTFQTPPPYHIAAAYSKQAIFFMQSHTKSVPKTVNYSPETSSCSVMGREKDEQIEPEEIETCVNNQSINEGMNPRPGAPQVPVKIKEHDHLYSLEGKQITSTVNSLTEENSLPVDVSKEENLSDEVTFLSLPSNNVNFGSVSNNDVEIKRNSNFGEKNEVSYSSTLTHEHNSSEPTKDDAIRREQNASEVFENGVESVTSNISNKVEFERLEDDSGEVPFLQKPQTFTQDKPVVSESVIAPTPQRPRSASFGTSTQSLDTKVSPLPAPNSQRKVSGIPRAFNRIPPHTAFPQSPGDQSCTEDDVLNSSNKALQKLDKDKPRESFNISPNTKIPVPCFPSPKKENLCPKGSRVLSNAILQDSDIISSSDIVRVEQNYYHAPQRMTLADCNLNTQCKPLHEVNLSPHRTSSSLYGDGSEYYSEPNAEISDIHSISEQPSKTAESPVSQQLRVSVPMNLSSLSNLSMNSPAEPQSKHPSKWMFGPHKNATVFPVTIQKNSGLGFSISGGMKAISNSERYENEIFVTKVHPNGPASKVIMPGDKILEVDGIDFTKLEHDEAVSVLMQTGNIVNMMISRHQ